MPDTPRGSAAPLTHTPIPSCEDPKQPACLACTDAADRCVPWPCDSAALTPESLGLEPCESPTGTYIDGADRVWVGAKWDISQTGGRFSVYRKGNYRLTVGSLALALLIVQDNEGFPA